MSLEKNASILVVDDEWTVRASLCSCLEDAGYRILEADGGRAGLALFDEESVDLVLLDLRMPDMDGLEVLDVLSTQAPDTPVIVVSGTGRIQDTVEALRLGAWDYLIKPIGNLSVLTHAVEKTLERARLIRSASRYRERLEEEVAVRTQELREANEELQEANSALAASEQRYRLLAENVRDNIWLCDLREMKLKYVSPASTHIMGYAPEELEGKAVTELISPDQLNQFVQPLMEQAAKGEDPSASLEIQYPHKEGHLVWIEMTLKFLRDEAGIPAEALGVARDITERKREEADRLALEAKVQHAQKLESLGVLAGGIAHDFNNLLVGILGNANLAIMDIPETSPAYDCVRDVETTAERAADLVQQMLAYSGKSRLVAKELNLTWVVREMVHLLEVAIAKTATVEYCFDDDVPTILADPTQLRQVTMNLITNASESLQGEPGRITVTTGSRDCSRAELAQTYLDDELPEGPYVFVEVNDTGAGMDQTTLARIFDPFYTTKFTGRGLGLAATLGIVRSHRGAIQVRSGLGEGTTFLVLFPTSQAATDDRGSKPDSEIEWQGSGTILLVDDEEMVLAVGTRMLRRLGFEVLTAENGKAALQVFDREVENISCVILDMTMPRMDGEACLAELRRRSKEVPVILSSGYDEGDMLDHFAGKDLDGFVQKPYTLENLKERLRQVLEDIQ